MKPTLYLAGPIQGRSDAEANDWRKEVEFKWGRGRVRNPMTRDYRGREMNEGVAMQIVHGDLADISQCGALLAYVDSPSWGTAMEIFFAYRAGLKVVVVYRADPKIKPPSPWLLFHCHAMVDTIDKALAFLEKRE